MDVIRNILLTYYKGSASKQFFLLFVYYLIKLNVKKIHPFSNVEKYIKQKILKVKKYHFSYCKKVIQKEKLIILDFKKKKYKIYIIDEDINNEIITVSRYARKIKVSQRYHCKLSLTVVIN